MSRQSQPDMRTCLGFVGLLESSPGVNSELKRTGIASLKPTTAAARLLCISCRKKSQ